MVWAEVGDHVGASRSHNVREYGHWTDRVRIWIFTEKSVFEQNLKTVICLTLLFFVHELLFKYIYFNKKCRQKYPSLSKRQSKPVIQFSFSVLAYYWKADLWAMSNSYKIVWMFDV